MARVIIVASIFLTVYSFLNIFFILKIPKIRKNGRFVFRLFSIIFATTPFIFIASSRNGHHLTSIVSGNIGYTWLAFVFLFLFAFPLSLIILKIAKKKRNFAFPASILIALFILLYGRYESQHIRAEFVKIETDKITEPKIRIVQISDIHFSPLTGRNFAEKVRDIVNSLSPDIVVSTGDLIDRGIRHPKEIAAILRTIEAPLGKYAVTGNHEFYYGMRESIRFTWASGFTLLRGRSIVKEGLTIAGVDDQSPFLRRRDLFTLFPAAIQFFSNTDRSLRTVWTEPSIFSSPATHTEARFFPSPFS